MNRKFLILLLFVPWFFNACSMLKKKNSFTLKVLSYNIHHANPPSRAGVIDLEAIAKVVKESGADIVGLQEVDVHTSRSGKDLDQAKKLAEMTGMNFFFVKAIDFAGGEYGIAILSRFPFVSTDSVRLPMAASAGGEPRVMAVATIEPVRGRKITFGNTHLDLKPANRRLQAEKIAGYFRSIEHPVVFCGDLNAAPQDDVIGIFDHTMVRSSIINGFTFPQDTPEREIDYIMFKPASRIAVMNHQVLDERYASDHRPLLLELKIR